MNAILCQTTCVTGGGSGIGQAVGVPLCAAGWTVIAGRKVETLDLSEPGNSLRALD
jgi:NAD(P)-dependent dehydrogenase (short-subunit alcohol dehydrogenase family)